jgi:hypothetical protein
MAQKKKAAPKKKAATKKTVAGKTTAAKKPTTVKAPPSKPQYEDVHAARLSWELAEDRVTAAKNNLTKVRADHSDFAARDLRVADATDILANARAGANDAKDNFMKVKAEAQ